MVPHLALTFPFQVVSLLGIVKQAYNPDTPEMRHSTGSKMSVMKFDSMFYYFHKKQNYSVRGREPNNSFLWKAWRQIPGITGIYYHAPPFYLLRQGLSLSLVFVEPQGSTCYCSPNL